MQLQSQSFKSKKISVSNDECTTEVVWGIETCFLYFIHINHDTLLTAFDRSQTRRFLAKSRRLLLRKGVTRIRCLVMYKVYVATKFPIAFIYSNIYAFSDKPGNTLHIKWVCLQQKTAQLYITCMFFTLPLK